MSPNDPKPRPPKRPPRPAAPPRRAAPPGSPKPAQPEPAPEIAIGYEAAGDEMLDAIAEELGDVEVTTQEDLTPPARRRPRRSTLGYADRIPNAPGAQEPGPAMVSLPEISIGQAPVGRQTWAAIERELKDDVSDEAAADEGEAAADEETAAEASAHDVINIFELFTYILRGPRVALLASQKARRDFVRSHLMQRLPIDAPDQIERIDIAPSAERETVILRIWCRVN